MPEPMVTLSTLAPDRQIVRIDAIDYELKLADDLSLLQRRELNRAWTRILQIEEKENITKTEDQEYENLSRKLTGLLLIDYPREKLIATPRSVCEAVVMAFFGNPSDPRVRMMMAMMMQNAIPQTGETFLADSNVSTEETQNDGSTSQADS